MKKENKNVPWNDAILVRWLLGRCNCLSEGKVMSTDDEGGSRWRESARHEWAWSCVSPVSRKVAENRSIIICYFVCKGDIRAVHSKSAAATTPLAKAFWRGANEKVTERWDGMIHYCDRVQDRKKILGVAILERPSTSSWGQLFIVIQHWPLSLIWKVRKCSW